MQSVATRIEVLGRARVHSPLGARHMERKAAALVTYLAIEGPTQRSRLASLLWPDAPNKAARGNLRQLLRRLRLTLGEDSLAGEDPIWLCEGFLVDALLFRRISEAREYSKLHLFRGELLAGFSYDDCEELDEWLRLQRTRFHEQQCRAAEAEALRLEQAGQLEAALETVRRLLQLQPTSEHAWQMAIRLHLRLGNRPSALLAYRDCQEQLNREFGIEPSPETRALVQELERPLEQERPRTRAPEEMTLAMLSPPQLVGREDEWAHLEEAWAAGRPIYVLGEAGIGKTRLVSEFCSAQGSWLLVAARPADPSTPYATSARVSRAVLGLEPERTLEPWVRQEIARLVPELDPSAPPLPSSPEEKARLAEALARLIRTRCGEMLALVLDDAHRADAASLELHLRVQDLLLEPEPGGDALRMLTCFRTGELAPAFEERLREHREAGLAAWLSLEPLMLTAAGELLAQMGVPRLEAIVPQLVRYTGCNPLFLIETVRSLVSAGFDGSFPAAPPLSDRVTWIVEQRLKRLSRDALRLARTVALAGADFSLELAACVLGLNVDQLAAPWKELEEAKVLRGSTFTQGVLRRLVIETLPQPVREAVLRRISACLQQRR
ncbi:AAA family ATPase [Archangium violaceum]|uniref:AAA family ATPase n=1 Tax=Archangium violaceum TaxID=83451 RepID=UPI0036DA392A